MESKVFPSSVKLLKLALRLQTTMPNILYTSTPQILRRSGQVKGIAILAFARKYNVGLNFFKTVLAVN